MDDKPEAGLIKRTPIDSEDDRDPVGPDVVDIRVLLRQDDSIDGMKKIADKFSIGMKRVLAIKDEMEEEKRRMEHEQAMQQRMMQYDDDMKMIIGRHLGGQGMTVSLIGK